MINKQYKFFIGIALTFISLNLFASEINFCSKKTDTLLIANTKINVEVVCSDLDKAKGLMYRNNLPKNNGMLFVYQDPQILNFWMKNTYVPLDIIFLDKDLKVVSIKTMKPLDVTPVSSDKLSNYAIEVNAGFSGENKIKVGDLVKPLN